MRISKYPNLTEKERNRIATAAYYARNKEKRMAWYKEYNKLNPDKRRATVRKWKAKKRMQDPFFFIKEGCRNRICAHMRSTGRKKRTSSFAMIGCTPEELRTHLQSKFQEGMTWENYGEWHIDHIIPLSSAKDQIESEKLCHYINLQPLWAKDNLNKSNKLIYA